MQIAVGQRRSASRMRHGGTHAEAPHRVIRRGHDAAPARSADDHRPALQFRPIPFLDGRIEGVHINVQNRSQTPQSTVMVIFCDMQRRIEAHMRGVGKHQLERVLPGLSVNTVSVWPLPKCTTLSVAGSGASSFSSLKSVSTSR